MQNFVLEQDHGKFFVDGTEVEESEFDEVAKKVYELANDPNSRLVVKLRLDN